MGWERRGIAAEEWKLPRQRDPHAAAHSCEEDNKEGEAALAELGRKSRGANGKTGRPEGAKY